MSSIDLLVASTNAKKLKELHELMADLPFKIHSLKDFPDVQEVPEDGKSFLDNAILKAQGYAKQTGMLTLAEDSGLCCDALDGAPGVYSARFAGEGKDDHDNNEKLLRLMEPLPDNCREAHYVSTVVLATADKVIGSAEGEVHGYIIKEYRGNNGFGYDPIFFYPPFDKTFGEVSAEMKHEVSHRSQAFKKLRVLLEEFSAQTKD